MKIAGIIAEYNPFHNGHQYQLQETRKRGATHIAVVMSGNFTQRGEPALFDKFARAKAAVSCGADLVVELPTIYSCAPAPDFAYASVFLLSQLSIDSLCFGSECGKIDVLNKAAQICQEAEHHPMIKKLIGQGVSYPQAREQVVYHLYGASFANLIRQPNNLLGIEYLRAIEKLRLNITPWTIARIGTNHDSLETKEHFASASYLRQTIRNLNITTVASFIPSSAYQIFESEIKAGRAVVSETAYSYLLLAALRQAKPQELSCINGITEGLENRLIRAAKEAVSAAELLQIIGTKRYSNARLRRALLCCVLGIKKSQILAPQYLRILACNQKGTEILNKIRKKATIPVTPKFAQLTQIGCSQAKDESLYTDLYYLMTQNIQRGGLEYIYNPYIEF